MNANWPISGYRHYPAVQALKATQKPEAARQNNDAGNEDSTCSL
jgi:hypothetical protein